MASVIQTAEQLGDVLHQLVEHKVSDIFITANKRISVRQDGDVKHTDTIAPGEEVLIEFLNRSGDTQIQGSLRDVKLHPTGAVDGAIECHKRRYRYNFYLALDTDVMRQTVMISLRLLNDAIPTPEEINFPIKVLNHIDKLKQGLVLVCGKTGMGKSTTLASILQHRANKFKEHIITLEQPIEYVLRSEISRISQREVGISVDSFASGLRSALRQNPDSILVGEIRDMETAEIALRASESGHIVFGTLHTSSAAQSIERFVNMFPTAQQPAVWNVLSTALKVLICQVLVKAREGGRIAVKEVLVTEATGISAYIKQKDLAGVRRGIEAGYNDYGMLTWQKAAEQVYRQGLITDEVKQEIINLGE